MTVTAYASGGKRYAALRAPVGYVYLAPIAGTVRVQLYQFIEGEVRVGSFVPSLPFFPYVTVQSADRRVIYRPGALNADTEMLIKDGERAEQEDLRALHGRGLRVDSIIMAQGNLRCPNPLVARRPSADPVLDA